MCCPHCASTVTRERQERTELGYRRYRCRVCKREFNERTGTRFNHLQYPTDVVCLVVLGRVRYNKLSLRDLPEMFLERGLVFTQEAVRAWEAQFAPVLSEMLRKHRRGRMGPSW
jgi:transposase-like protein